MTHGGQEGLFESAVGTLLFMLLLGQDTRLKVQKSKATSRESCAPQGLPRR
jgi:hypothetical protein